jgi:hypothetical protein
MFTCPAMAKGKQRGPGCLQSYSVILSLTVAESSGESISATNLSPQYRDELGRRVARNHWVPGARFLVNTAPVTDAALTQHQVVIVCDTPYSNVPQRRFIKAPPTHAVGYSDGSIALISPAEFNKLNKASFVPLDTLYPLPPAPPQTLVIPEQDGVQINPITTTS